MLSFYTFVDISHLKPCPFFRFFLDLEEEQKYGHFVIACSIA